MSITPDDIRNANTQALAGVDELTRCSQVLLQERDDALGQVTTLTGQITTLTEQAGLSVAAYAALAKAFEDYKARNPEEQTFVIGMAYKTNTDPAPVEKRIGLLVDVSKTYYGAGDLTKAVARVQANIAAGRAVSEISFKAPFTWADMAAGKGDAWALAIATALQKAIAGTTHLVRIAFNHEPENDKPDSKGVGDNGATAAGRDQWRAMQVRLAPIFDVAGIEFIVILMGYHSIASTSNLYKIWRLELAIPDSPHIKGVGYDLYETYAVIDKDTGKPKGWRNWETYCAKIKAFHDTRPGLKWGLSEHGWTDAAETSRPGYLITVANAVAKYGGSWILVFSVNLATRAADWEMPAGSAREKTFAQLLMNGPTA